MKKDLRRFVPSTKPLTLKEIILYNLAGFSFNIYDTILYAWVMYFYITATTGHAQYITTMLVGVILFGGRILDALTDPFIGYMSDRTKTRWGRRKPYMFISYPILFISFVLVWTPPVNGTHIYNALYLGAVLFFYYWSYTGVLIPWFAMLPEMSRDNQERVKIASIGVAIGVFAALLAGGIAPILYQKTGAFMMALVFGLVGFIVGEFGLFGTRERYRPDLEEETPGFFTAMKATFQDRQVLSFAIMIMLVQLTYQLMLMIVPFLTTLVLGLEEGMSSIILGEVIFLMGAVVPLWFYLLSKFPKRNVFRGIIVTMIVGFVGCYFIGEYPFGSPLVQAMLIIPIAAIPIGGMFTAVLGIISDLTDLGELKTGKRREAIYFGIYGIVRKFGWAFSSIILTGVFTIFDPSGKPTVFGVRVVWLMCAAVCLLGLLAFIPYKLGDTKEETKKIMGL
ncbi:MAG: MFS transporter [Deltaproteobacteria bacterium]|uniref:MFS transporter n=1 Tax=Candidatus Zymogenus saltonus TaxID=2844893 RepID=A0A9D8KF06_9DELT|nr:MFS transporter [Candidatus Zymogenus saltonus]